MKVESPNDILLIQQTLFGNKDAFEKLVRKHRPMTFALVNSYVGNAADKEKIKSGVPAKKSGIHPQTQAPTAKTSVLFSFVSLGW